ncbi:MAG: chemotaxis protein CheB [Campylobacterales bacterium]|nr:chemotaxis protein CheB [Campylobacterales bacterium]
MNSLEHNKIVLIGASTGGPAHIEKILLALQKPLCFTLIIAQHMGQEFLPSFVQRLSLKTNHTIELVKDGSYVEKGKVYIVTQRCSLIHRDFNLLFHVESKHDARFNPEIDYLFHSATIIKKTADLLAIILTGIGDDGVDGCVALAKNGVQCLGESEKTAVVYGMPARAKEKVPNIEILDLQAIITAIQKFGEC